MVHAMLLLCDRMASALDAIATELASKSAFVRETTLPFHVPLLGSLHSYGAPEIAAALQSVAARAAPLSGRCLRWEVTRRTLRVLVALEGDEPIETALHKRLARGKTWRPRAITVGSIEQIDQTQHAAFLSAVEAAFPITDSSTLECAAIANSDQPDAAVTLHGKGMTSGASAAGTADSAAAALPSDSRGKKAAGPSASAKKSAALASTASAMEIEPRLVGIKKHHHKRRKGVGVEGGGKGKAAPTSKPGSSVRGPRPGK